MEKLTAITHNTRCIYEDLNRCFTQLKLFHFIYANYLGKQYKKTDCFMHTIKIKFCFHFISCLACFCEVPNHELDKEGLTTAVATGAT